MSRFVIVPLVALFALLVVACDDSGVASPTSVPTDGEQGATATLSADLQTAVATFEGSPRPVETPTPGAERAPEVAASEDLASRLGQPVEDIVVVSVVAMDWPDSCLGVPSDGEVCAQVVTPGFEVVLEIGFTTYTYHTNANGTVARFADVTIGEGPSS